MKRIAIVGGGVAGLAAAYELTLLQSAGADLAFTLFEATGRVGGIVDTTRIGGFVLEGGPDGWVSEKPWARDLAIELGLADELVESNDASRVTYILRDGRLLPLPDGMRMMVPTDLGALKDSALISDEARRRYSEEPTRAAALKASAPDHDETVACFVERHFGREVLDVIGAPLLNGVFGGDVQKLSVQAVMQPFVQMEHEHGSLILALQRRARERGPGPTRSIFTTLRSGVGALTDALAARIDPGSLRCNETVRAIQRIGGSWRLASATTGDGVPTETTFDVVLLCTPVHTTRDLLSPLDDSLSGLLAIPGSSAVIAALGFAAGDPVTRPRGFGFLAPASEGVRLLAATFADEKFPGRVPDGAHAIRADFGGNVADALLSQSDREITNLAHEELERILGPLPAASHTVVRRWPLALPQYHVGHVERMASLDARIASFGNLHLLGNGYRGVGLPDIIRDARDAARCIAN